MKSLNYIFHGILRNNSNHLNECNLNDYIHSNFIHLNDLNYLQFFHGMNKCLTNKREILKGIFNKLITNLNFIATTTR